MKLDTFTLVMVLSLVMGTQVIALWIQYKTNKTYKGIGHWLFGSFLMALSHFLMLFVVADQFLFLAAPSNPLLIIGFVFLYMGVKVFLNKKIIKSKLIALVLVFNVLYFYFLFIDSNITFRVVLITLTLGGVSFMTAYELLDKKDKTIKKSVNFLATIFIIYGIFYVFRIFYALLNINDTSEVYKSMVLMLSFVMTIILSNLWTYGLISMVNQRLNLENKMEKEKFKSIFNTNLDAQIISRLEDGFIVDVNGGFCKISGYDKKEVVGKYVKDIGLWENLNDRKVYIEDLKVWGICQNKEYLFKPKDRHFFYGLISSRIINIHGVDYVISVVRDVTERKEFEIAIIESEEKYRSILKASPDGITITDLQGNIEMVSPAANRIFGYDPDFKGFVGKNMLDFLLEEDVKKAKNSIHEMYKNKIPYANEYRGVRKDQSIFDIEVNSGFVYGADGQPVQMVFIVRDISKRKKSERQIQDLVKQLEIDKNKAQLSSITDSLTGLSNRGFFDMTFEREYKRLEGTGSPLSLIMLDIDYFKKYNDKYGHLAGDQCLKMIATSLKKIIRSGPDIVARFGGEEFIIVLPETDEEGAILLGERIRGAVEALAMPHSESDVSKQVTTSLGVVTVFPTNNISSNQVLELVDQALYLAKDRGRNQCVYSIHAKYGQLPILK